MFRAAPAEVFDAITNLDLFRLPVTRVLLEARGLPGRLVDAVARRHGETVVPEPPTFRVRDLPARGWILLGERPGTELVYGTVGEPWKGTGGSSPAPPVTAETFAAFTEPGFAKLAESTVVTPYGLGGCADVGDPGGDDRRGQPAPVPALLASGGAIHPADASDRDARPGSAIASRSRRPGGAVTAEADQASASLPAKPKSSPPRPVGSRVRHLGGS